MELEECMGGNVLPNSIEMTPLSSSHGYSTCTPMRICPLDPQPFIFAWQKVANRYLKICCCLLTAPASSVNCSFDNNICDYFVSSTSTSFELSYVFNIASLGKLNQIFCRVVLLQPAVLTTPMITRCMARQCQCFKNDNSSQWKSGKFDHRSLRNP